MLVRGCPFILLLLLINCLNISLVSSSSPSKNATRPRSRLSETTEDYNQYEDITSTPASSSSTNSEAPELNPCIYNMCEEQQLTCQELAVVANCLCPGLTSNFDPPSPPSIYQLTQKGDKGVVVHWCAPTSIVTNYIVWVKGNDKYEIKVEEKKRMVVLEDVAAGAHVCVRAVNKAGSSPENDRSCAKFEPSYSNSGLALKLGIIGGVVGLILLLILGLLLWRHKTRQKSRARPETEGVL